MRVKRAFPKGTRITVELILEKLAAGMTYEDILAALTFAHDYLTRQDIILADGQTL